MMQYNRRLACSPLNGRTCVQDIPQFCWLPRQSWEELESLDMRAEQGKQQVAKNKAPRRVVKQIGGWIAEPEIDLVSSEYAHSTS